MKLSDDEQRIVDWLRDVFQSDDYDDGNVDLVHWIASAIERGEHQPTDQPKETGI